MKRIYPSCLTMILVGRRENSDGDRSITFSLFSRLTRCLWWRRVVITKEEVMNFEAWKEEDQCAQRRKRELSFRGK